MGAEPFETVQIAATPGKAYEQAVKDAYYWHGHGGYTGTIAEKDGFWLHPAGAVLRISDYTEITEAFERAPQPWESDEAREAVKKYVKKLPANVRPLVTWQALKVHDDKWGPALCVEIGGGYKAKLKAANGRKGTRDRVFLFCGWAST